MLNELYDRFYSEGFAYTGVTSSHWRDSIHGWHKVHRDGTGELKLEGGGFGNFQSRSPYNFLRSFGVQVELKKLAKTYACDNNLLSVGEEIAKAQGRLFSFDCLKQLLSLSRLLSVLQSGESGGTGGGLTSVGIKRVCVIGDGYGYLGSVLKAADPGLAVTSVNLGKGLLFDVYYTLLAHPQATLSLAGETASAVNDGTDFIFLPAEDYSVLSTMPQDLVLNIASMQEMNISVVNSYLKYIRPKHASDNVLFYCCNRREKKLPAGELVRFTDYGWLEADKAYFDEPCPWYQKFPSGIFRQYLPFDGEILHRFVSLAPGTSSGFNELKQANPK